MSVIERFRMNVQKHKRPLWILLLSYIAFNGCFIFPFSNELFPFDIQKGVMVLVAYGMIGMLFAGLLEKRKSLIVLLLSFSFTVLGLILRYLLEYGEVSNDMNFIPISITLYLLIIPFYCLSVYLLAQSGYSQDKSDKT